LVLKGVLQRQMLKGIMNSVERRDFLLIVDADADVTQIDCAQQKRLQYELSQAITAVARQ
jgi:hypothetical protein